MKAVKIELVGRERYLAFTGNAMFRLEEEFGGVTQCLDAISAGTQDGLSALCRAAAILAEQGELARRYLGYDKVPIADAEAVRATLTPGGIPELRRAVFSSVELGFGREVKEEEDEVDLGLAELNAQKKTS